MKEERPRYYTKEFKWQVVQEVLQGKYSKEEARRVYGIKGKSAILEWTRTFSGQPRYGADLKKIKDVEEIKMKSKEKELLARIKELEKQLYVERHRALLNEEIVKVAEETFGIEIKKKFGAKQSLNLKTKKK